MTVFVDTSALYAAADGNDSACRRAVATWTDLLEQNATLVTTNYILLETSALIQHRLGLARLQAFHQDVFPLLSVEWVTPDRHRSGVEATLTSARRQLSVVDCISFQTMRELGIHTAFAFDTHFRQQGFRCIP